MPTRKLTDNQKEIFHEMRKISNENLSYFNLLFAITIYISRNFTRNDNCKTLKITEL